MPEAATGTRQEGIVPAVTTDPGWKPTVGYIRYLPLPQLAMRKMARQGAAPSS